MSDPYRRPGNTRPYRVGMARPQQRYIEPDVIYSDLARGERVSIPRQFPYSWNPVNGLGASEVQSSSFLDDAFNKVTDIVTEEGTKAGEGIIDEGKKRAGEGIQDIVKGTPGQQLLDEVEARARVGVQKEVQKHAPDLMLLAVAGGAVGGALSAKLGKTGTVLALAVAAWSGWQLLNAGAPEPKKKK